MSRPPSSGFSFVEVMAAVVILSISLIVLMDNQAKSMDMLGRARSADFATTLAIGRMTELVQLAKEKGLDALRDEESGEFDQEKFPTYRWRYWRAEVPPPDFEALILGATAATGQEDPNNSNAALLGGPLQAITRVWGKALQEVHVEVTWGEGRSQKSYELATQLIAPNAVAQVQMAIAAMTGGRSLGGDSSGNPTGGTP
jgi:type II secretory pathway pseudopilin PulG